MKKTILSLTLILAAFLAIDRLGALAMKWVFEHTNDIIAPKLRHLDHGVRQDILLLGTSRCQYHFVPQIITDSTALSAYNAGIDASDNVFAHYMVLQFVLQHHTPQVVVLQTSEDDYAQDKNPAGPTTFFAPYVGRNARMDAIFRQAGTYWPYQISHLYRYNAKALSNLAGLRKATPPDADNGYVYVTDQGVHPDSLIHDYAPKHENPVMIRQMETFINECHSRGITLVMTIPPVFSLVGPDRYAPLHRLARQHGVPLLDYHTPGLFTDRPDLFHDTGHMNGNGAQLFTAIFAHDLKQILEENKIIPRQNQDSPQQNP